jgi:predicted small secreted protein
MKKAVVLVLAAAALLAGCNTFEGVGKDVQSVGRTVEDAAK